MFFLFKDVDFPQVAVLGAFCTDAKRKKGQIIKKNKCFKDIMLVLDVECVHFYVAEE